MRSAAKKLLVAVLTLALLLSSTVVMMSGMAFDAEEKPNVPNNYPAITLVNANAQKEEVVRQPMTLTVLHTNDVHSRVADGAVAMAKIAGKVKKMRSLGENVLLLDAGDALHGKPIATLFEGASIAQIMGTMGYDAMSAGNHDFNYGYAHLKALDKAASFDILGANVVYELGGHKVLKDYIVREFDGYRVGIFGLSTPETKEKTHANNTKGIVFEDPIETASYYVKRLKNNEKCDYIICLGHIGLDESSKVLSSDICEAVEGIDLFVDGHSHTTLESGKKVGESLIVSTGEYADNVGYVTISINPDGSSSAEARLMNAEAVQSWPTHTATQKIVDEYSAKLEEMTKTVVGETDVLLVGDREVVRRGESNLANLAMDALRHETGADIAMSNGGGIRDSIQAGDITIKDSITVFPFGNLVITAKVKGQDILDTLEVGVSGYPATNGGFVQVSGMEYTFDASKPAGSRVTKVLIGGEALDVNKYYTVATNDFSFAFGDGWKLGNGTQIGEYGTLDEILLKYLKINGTKVEMGRITVING